MTEAKAEVEAEKVGGVGGDDNRRLVGVVNTDKSGIRRRRSEMHQTSEGHDSTRFSSFPHVSLRSRLVSSSRAPLSCGNSEQ
jgi:hypothetical protein